MEELDFLPDLPKPNLDDRKFEDLLNECILRIPRYCPEWTNHNPSDPGITLIELFSWLTEQMLMRFNQVPLRNYVSFLELLGIRLDPPVPAQAILTFYFTKVRPGAVIIPNQTEVSISNDQTQEPIVFTTARELHVGNPIIKHFLTAKLNVKPSQTHLRNYTPIPRNPDDPITQEQWRYLGEFKDVVLFEESRPGNCLYIVLDDSEPDCTVAGNVISINFRGEAARATGINPDNPPLLWEAWNGKEWQSGILSNKEDDRTQGFSFDDAGQQGTNPIRQGAEVELHLPLELPKTNLGTNYRGYWIRCTYTPPNENQPGYNSSPIILGLSVKSIGSAVKATECVQIQREMLGVSNGKAGQNFQLRETPVIQRQLELDEYIELVLPSGETEKWEEVENFANSAGEDPHYTIDSRTGIVQFGPLIREPAALQQKTRQRLQVQPKTAKWEYRRTGDRRLAPSSKAADLDKTLPERQYGKVPPPGAEVYMVAYRTGGGSKGNVKAGTLTRLKTSIPYVKTVINHEAARGGVDAESLTDAALRVPEILRSRETAVTPKDFEVITRAASKKVARAHCITDADSNVPGTVRLLIVPAIEANSIDFRGKFVKGMDPNEVFALDDELQKDIQAYLRERKPLGVQVKLEEPDYVGVKVEIEVILEPRYNNVEDKVEIRQLILATLYRFLNPITGGLEGEGWPLGRPLYSSDIVSQCRNISGVRNLGTVTLFESRKDSQGWFLQNRPLSTIHPGDRGIICSWDDKDQTLPSGHRISFID